MSINSAENSDENVREGKSTATDHVDGSKTPGGGCLTRFFMVIAVIVLTFFGFFFGSDSFIEIERMRQLERVPEVQNSSVISGEINLRGRAESDQELLRGPDTDEPAVFYRYIIEEDKAAGLGDPVWWETHRSFDRIDFILRDETGDLLIGATDSGIEFDVEMKSQRYSGHKRYTEYRIDHGEEVFVFGYAEATDQGYRVGFESDGSYYPLISSSSEAETRHYQTLWSGFFVVLGVTFLLFAVFFLLRVFRVHSSALYLVCATGLVVLVLGVQGLTMMISDLRGADEATAQTLVEGEQVVASILSDRGISWTGEFDEIGSLEESQYHRLSSAERERISGIRIRMAQSVERTNSNLSRFPEMIIAPLFGIQRFDEVAVPAEESAELRAIEDQHQPIRFGLFFGFLGALVGLGGAIFGTWEGIHQINLKRTMENVPTSPTSGVVYGLTELKGTVELREGTQAKLAPYSDEACVYYHHTLEEWADDDWKLVSDEESGVPFYCRDSTGRMLIDPEGARVILSRKAEFRDKDFRHTEWLIVPNDEIYVLGSATINPETHDTLMVANDDEKAPFVISSHSEYELTQQKASTGFLCFNFGIIATMIGGMGVAGMVVSFGPMLYLTMAAISCGYLFFVLIILYYNDFVFLRDRSSRNWSNIDIALKKRFDLISNFAEVMQEFLGQERALQEIVAKARTAHQGATHKAPDAADLATGEEARDQLLARLEAYPELKGQKIVKRMMQSLTDVEDEIALMRQGYNDSVERYNTRIYHIPEIFIAWPFGFRRFNYLRRRGES